MPTDRHIPGGTQALGPHATHRIDPLAQTAVPATRASEAGLNAPACEPGTMIDHFQVIRLIGRGGMGEVYLAYDTDLGRRVALKMVIGEWLSSEEAVERFLFEVRTTAKFNHPNIVTVYAAGKYEGRPYVALEYLQGQNLRQRMEERPPGTQESLRIMLPVVEALEEAHGHGVLHRDLKPENVILPLDGRLRVVDFGLAKQVRGVNAEMLRPIWEEDTADSEQAEALLSAAEAASTDARTAPQSDQGLKGTPAYMAPEQWLSEECTPATDIWAVGVILFELCARRLPYDHDNISKQLAAVCSPEPAPKVEQFARVPDELAALIGRCLDKDPSFRPLPADVAAALRDMLYDTTAAVSGRESPFRGLMPFTERHAGLFFGREAEIAAFVERVRHHPVLPVVGASGAGKSSFIQAGVIPRLREQEPWIVLRLRPGNRPFHAVATRLVRGDSWQDRDRQEDSMAGLSRPGHSGRSAADLDSSGALSSTDEVSVDAPTMVSKETPTQPLDEAPSPAAATSPEPDSSEGEAAPSSITAQQLTAEGEAIGLLEKQLVESPRRLSLRLRSLAEKQDAKVLLFVDQLEELFTLVEDQATRERFIQALCTAAEDPQDPVRVVFTVRDDFLGRLAVSAEAREALTHVTVIQRLGPSALGQTLLRPAEAAGYRFDDETLVRQMVASVEGEPAGLPLLQFAAQMLWERRDTKQQLLLRSAYEEIGGVEGALAKHADGVLDGLSPSELKVARELLLRLVTPERTRKVIAQADALHGLRSGEDEGEGADARTAERVLDRLTAARLVHVSRVRGDEEAESVLELAHESLIHTWTTLARWIDEGREELAFVAEVAQAAELWDRRGRRPEELWRGSAVEEALRTASRCTAPLPQLVVDFLDAAQAKHRRRQQRVRAAIASAIGLSVAVAVVATLIALFVADKEREAREQRDLAEQREARALEEGARAALGDGRLLEARAKLRAALEKEETASTSARGLWWQLERNPLVWTQEFGATVYSVAFSPDGKTVAAGCQDHAVYLLDAETRATRVLRGHEDQVLAVDFSPDGSRLATAGWDGAIRVWDLERGSILHAMQGHEDGIRTIAYSPNGGVIATGNYANSIRLWNAKTGALVRTLTGHKKSIISIRFSHDARWLASGGSDRVVRIWDVGQGVETNRCQGHTETVLAVDFSPDGSMVATGSRDRSIRIWRSASCEMIDTLEGHTGAVSGLRFASDGKTLVSSGRDGTLRVWDVASRRQVRVLRGHDSAVWGVGLSQGGRLAASGGADHTVRLWSVETRQEQERSPSHRAPVWGASFSADGRRLASAGLDGKVHIWNVKTGQVVQTLTGHDGPVRAVAMAADGATVASGGEDRSVRVWNVESGKEERKLTGHLAAVRGVAFSLDGHALASASLDDTLRLWDLDTGKLRHTLTGHGAGVSSVQFDPAGKLLASGGLDASIRLWDAATGKPTATWTGPTGEIWSIAFSPDGSRLASNGLDRTVRLWSVADGNSRVVGRHQVRGAGVSVHDDGQRIASSGANGEAFLWNVADGTRLPLVGHRGDVNAIVFGAHGTLVGTAGDDTTVRVWRTASGRPAWHAPAIFGAPPRLLSHRGWERMIGASDDSGDHRSDSPAALPGPRTRAALERGVRFAETADGKALCVQAFDHTLQLWDLPADAPIAGAIATGVFHIAALPESCVAVTRKDARIVTASGETRQLPIEGHPTAAAWSDGVVLIATEGQVHALSQTGELLARYAASAGTITSLAGEGLATRSDPQSADARWLAVGYRDGNIEMLSLEEAAQPATSAFEAVPASAPVRMKRGPLGTLIVGYGNGLVGLWNLADGKQLAHARLHGPVRHVLLEGRQLFAASELGDYTAWDLDPFYQSHCELLAEVWRRVPITWRDGRPTATSPTAHPCAAADSP